MTRHDNTSDYMTSHYITSHYITSHSSISHRIVIHYIQQLLAIDKRHAFSNQHKWSERRLYNMLNGKYENQSEQRSDIVSHLASIVTNSRVVFFYLKSGDRVWTRGNCWRICSASESTIVWNGPCWTIGTSGRQLQSDSSTDNRCGMSSSTIIR